MTEAVLAYLGIGSNLDDPLAHVMRAVDELAHRDGIQVRRMSHWYGSTAIGPGTQPDYVNGAVEIETTLDPLTLLRHLQTIEQAHGRTRGERWDARTLDLDILLYDDAVIDTPDLQIPHPRLADRRFVLAPLADLCPERTVPCPSTGKNATIAGLLQQLPAPGVWRLPSSR